MGSTMVRHNHNLHVAVGRDIPNTKALCAIHCIIALLELHMQQMITVLRTDKDKNELLTNYEIQVLETVGPLAPMFLTPFLRYCLPKQEHIEGDGDVRVFLNLL